MGILTCILRIERLLRTYGVETQANLASRTAERIAAGEGLDVLSTLDWWGGAGSIADVHLSRKPWDLGRPAEELDRERRDNSALRKALIEVHARMEKAGVHYDRAASWAAVFQDWKDEGL